MEDRLNQMNAVLQAMQKTLQCNICLDLLNTPLTTKCGHSFCAECIQQVVKGPRSSAQCPLCMAHITRRSLGQNNKIASLVTAVRKIIESIKKDCAFEVTPSKYRPRPRPVISAEDDDSENEENDEPRRGTRKRGITDHYNAEVPIPKPRARSVKQRILTSNGGQELSLHTDGKPETHEPNVGISDRKERVSVDVISQEHSYSSPTKQEPLERKSLIPSFTRGRGARSSGSGLLFRGKAKLAASVVKDSQEPIQGKLAKDNKKPVATYLRKKDVNASSGIELLSVSQQVNNATFPPEKAINKDDKSSVHLSEKLGKEKPADKVAKWLHNSSEVGFQIGASLSTDTTSNTESESSQVFNPSKNILLPNPKSSAQMSEANNSGIKTGIKKYLFSSKTSSSSTKKSEESSVASSFTESKRFFKTKGSTGSPETDLNDPQNDVETQVFDPVDYVCGTPSDPYNFIPSQKTPKDKKIVAKQGQGAKSRARGTLNLGRGRVRGRLRGRGRGRGIPDMRGLLGKIDDTIVNASTSFNSTIQKHSTPVSRGAKLNRNVNLSIIKPPDTSTDITHEKQIESVIVCTHDEEDDDIPDSCPVNTKNEFDVLVSEVKESSRQCNAGYASQPPVNPCVEEDKEANLIFITPAQGDEMPLTDSASKVQVKRNVKKRASDESDNESGTNKKTNKKQTVHDSSRVCNSSSKLQSVKDMKSKAEKAKEEVETLCSMFEDIEDHNLHTVSIEDEEEEKKNSERAKENLMRENILLVNETFENTQHNKTVSPLVPKDERTMPPPKAPVRSRKVRFNSSAPVKSGEVHGSEESAPSTSTRSSGKIPSRTSHNVRYASEMKSKLIDTSKTVAVSVSVKYAKSPGWSHVEGARRDLKVRQASLNITGGEQRSMNDSRTEGGTCGHSTSALMSSGETNMTIDEETQDFDVEHLASSQTKKDRVKKLKEIVSQLREEEEKQHEHKQNVIKMRRCEKSKMLSSERKVKNVKTPNLLQKLKTNMNTKCRGKGETKLVKSLPFSSETESFCIDDQVDNCVPEKGVILKSSVKSLSRSLSVMSRKRNPRSISASHETEHHKQSDENDNSQSLAKKKRRTFSLTATTQDLDVLHDNCEMINESSNCVHPDIGKVPTGDAKEKVEMGMTTLDPSRETPLLASSSTVVSKCRPPHHNMSPSSTSASPSKIPFLSSSDTIEGNASSQISQTSPRSPSKITSTQCQGSATGSKVVPFKSMGSLCSERCGTAADDANLIASFGGFGRDFCLHAVPCEVYQVLMKYMSLMVTQEQHKKCCKTVTCNTKETAEPSEPVASTSNSVDHDDELNSQLAPQKCEVEAERSTEDHEQIMVEHITEQPEETKLSQIVHDSEVIPGSYSTEDMAVALPLPNNIDINTCVKNLQPRNSTIQQAVKSSDGNTNVNQEISVNGEKSTQKDVPDVSVKDSNTDHLIKESSTPSSEIPLDKCALRSLTRYGESSLSHQMQNSESSQQSVSLLGAADVSSQESTSLLGVSDVGDNKVTRASKNECSSNENVKVEGIPAEKNDRRTQGSQRYREKGIVTKSIIKDELVELEKENLKNTGNFQPAINRPRRKPLQSGQPALENIMSQGTKDAKMLPDEKEEVVLIQNHLPHESQKTIISQSKSTNSKPLFSDSSNRSNSSQKGDFQKTANFPIGNKDPENTDYETPLKESLIPTKRKFKRIRKPANSDSSSEGSDSEAILNPPKRKPKVISSSSSNQSSAAQKTCITKSESLEQHPLDSEEMRDLERLDQNVWEYFGYPDEDAISKTDEQNSQISNDDGQSQKLRDIAEQDEPLPVTSSIPSDDEEIPSTAEVVRNVNADMLLIRKMREREADDSEVIIVTSQDSTFSSSTKNLFTKVDKSLSKAEALFETDNNIFEDLCTPLEEKSSGGTVTTKDCTKSNHSTKSHPNNKAELDGQAPNSVGDSDQETEDDMDNISHSSAYSSQSEAVSTQRQKQVKDEVEILKARVRELEAVIQKKKGSETGNVYPIEDVLPPTCPAVDSGDESEELFSSLPDLTASSEPKLPPSNNQTKNQKKAARAVRSGIVGPPQLVCTGLTSSEMGKVQDLVNKLGVPGSCVKRSWGEGITHVVVKTEPDCLAQRTLKYLFGVAAGCWVITLQWVLDSLSTKKLLPEEDYEVLDCTGAPGPQRGRTNPKPLFRDCQFYVKPPLFEVTTEQLKELIELCGAQVVDSPVKFSKNKQCMKLVVVQTEANHDADEMLTKYKKVCISHDWIIECIGMYAHICIAPYIMGSPNQNHLAASCLPPSLLEETQEL
nr:uncharacterized protein LOC123771312 [Procambarus clarkii]